MEIYRQASRILATHGLDWRFVRAGCVRCRGCSALPDYQDALALERAEQQRAEGIELQVVDGGPMLEASFAIRHEVFVQEQGLFRDTDRDELDPVSLHILAMRDKVCVGTVRITHLGDGNWLGSRLAVREPFRGQAGRLLVKRAEQEVRRWGGVRFCAYIQAQKVAFFESCQWRCLQRIPNYHGRPHVLMSAAGLLWEEDRPVPLPGNGRFDGADLEQHSRAGPSA